MDNPMKDRVYLYDSTLRDGAQARGVDFTVADKQAIARELDRLGIDHIEGGWPGANPNDDMFFAAAPKLAHAKLAAFGMTRRAGLDLSEELMQQFIAVWPAFEAMVRRIPRDLDRAAEPAHSYRPLRIVRG